MCKKTRTIIMLLVIAVVCSFAVDPAQARKKNVDQQKSLINQSGKNAMLLQWDQQNSAKRAARTQRRQTLYDSHNARKQTGEYTTRSLGRNAKGLSMGEELYRKDTGLSPIQQSIADKSSLADAAKKVNSLPFDAMGDNKTSPRLIETGKKKSLFKDNRPVSFSRNLF